MYHLPIQYPNNPWLTRVKNNIINLIISMHKRTPIHRLTLPPPKEIHHLIIMRDLPHRLSRLLIPRLRLINRQFRERLQLPIVEAAVSAKVAQSGPFDVNFVEFGQCSQSIVPSAGCLVSIIPSFFFSLCSPCMKRTLLFDLQDSIPGNGSQSRTAHPEIP